MRNHRVQLTYSGVGMNRKPLTFLTISPPAAKLIAIVLVWFLFIWHRDRNVEIVEKPLKKPIVVQVSDNKLSLVANMPTVQTNGINLDPDFNWAPKRRGVTAPILMSTAREEKRPSCSPFPWQLSYFPTCNVMHELGIGQLRSTSYYGRLTQIQYINSGYNRSVWRIGDRRNEMVALKTLVMEKEFTFEKIEKQKRDAIISERSTFSEKIADIFAYCGASALNEFAFEGTLEDAYPTLGKVERLRVAVDVAKALADMHSIGPVVHADIAVRQYLKINGGFKLNDFNTSGMMYRNNKTGGNCRFEIGKAGDKNRAPEEMLPPYLVTQAIDVYSMGNIFWKLLTNKRKYDEIPTFEAQKLIIDGQEPVLRPEIGKSTHAVDVALRNAIGMCLQRRAEDRKSAEEIYLYLSKAFADMELSGEQTSILSK